MKTKDFKKKLSLNKKTVAHLGSGAMDDVRGGTWASCPITACNSRFPPACASYIKCPSLIITSPGCC